MTTQTKKIPIVTLFMFLFRIVFVCSYAEVRAEQRREMGIEESPPELPRDKVRCF